MVFAVSHGVLMAGAPVFGAERLAGHPARDWGL